MNNKGTPGSGGSFRLPSAPTGAARAGGGGRDGGRPAVHASPCPNQPRLPAFPQSLPPSRPRHQSPLRTTQPRGERLRVEQRDPSGGPSSTPMSDLQRCLSPASYRTLPTRREDRMDQEASSPVLLPLGRVPQGAACPGSRWPPPLGHAEPPFEEKLGHEWEEVLRDLQPVAPKEGVGMKHSPGFLLYAWVTGRRPRSPPTAAGS